MSDGDKIIWSPEHRMRVFWFEKGVALLVMVGGSVLVYMSESTLAQGTGLMFASAGLVKALPSFWPLYSKIVQRLPFLGEPVNNGSDDA